MSFVVCAAGISLGYVEKPFNNAAQQLRGKLAQTVSSTANARIIAQLGYKLASTIEIDESYTSQTCPVCGERSKHQRTYRCPKCGLVAPRDFRVVRKDTPQVARRRSPMREAHYFSDESVTVKR
jgi:tRNA(Ile2) C34 agmatinyltransferase TiaS